ncbi:hypothetical protein DMUE_5859 [Dictyocoela muelleri]|nr:hypothetical protein DMUE_5859 [Dictyocoela muelleri]
MLFRNNLFTLKKRSSTERTGKSNAKVNSFDDKIEDRKCEKDILPAAKNVGFPTRITSMPGSQCVFMRNMTEKNVKIEIFMFEGEENFELLSLRAKMTQLVKKSSSEVKEWYYEMGIEDKLPEIWTDFKSKLVDFCSSQGIDSMSKYRDELWSQYLERLRCVAQEKNISEEDVFRKLRRENPPKTLQMIFYSFGVSLKDVYKRVIEWESNVLDKKLSSMITRINIQKERILFRKVKSFVLNVMNLDITVMSAK